MVNVVIILLGSRPDPAFTLLVQQFIKAGVDLNAQGKILLENKSSLRVFLLAEKSKGEHLQGKQKIAEEIIKKKAASEDAQFAHTLGASFETLNQVIAESTNLLIFDISNLKQKSKSLPPLLKILEKSKCAILFLNPKHPEFKHIILKYDGTGTSITSFSQLFPEKARKAVTSSLISPLTFKKYQVAAEKRFIKKATAAYAALGFIKLPLDSITDLVKYAVGNKADLLILSKTDLKDLFKTLSDKKLLHGRHRLSVFVGASLLH